MKCSNLLNYFNDNVNERGNFNLIKDKINIEKYQTKNNSYLYSKIILIISIPLFIIFLFCSALIKTHKVIYLPSNNLQQSVDDLDSYIKISRTYYLNIIFIICLIITFLIILVTIIFMYNKKKNNTNLFNNHINKSLCNYKNIFIGKVEEEINKNDFYIFYKIKIIKHLKGNGNEEEVVCFYLNQYNKNKVYKLFQDENDMPLINNYYIFFVNQNNLLDKRLMEINYLITSNEQKILLKDYDDNKSIENQNNEIIDLIKQI